MWSEKISDARHEHEHKHRVVLMYQNKYYDLQTGSAVAGNPCVRAVSVWTNSKVPSELAWQAFACRVGGSMHQSQDEVPALGCLLVTCSVAVPSPFVKIIYNRIRIGHTRLTFSLSNTYYQNVLHMIKHDISTIFVHTARFHLTH